MSALANARRRTALVLKGQPLPEAFLNSTIAAFCNAHSRGASKQERRRLAGKVKRLGALP